MFQHDTISQQIKLVSTAYSQNGIELQ